MLTYSSSFVVGGILACIFPYFSIVFGGWRRSYRQHHALHTVPAYGFHIGTHSHTHVQHHARVALEGGVRVAHDVGGPLMLGGVGVTGADVFVLQGFELLLCAEFIGLPGIHMSVVSGLDIRLVASTYHFVE